MSALFPRLLTAPKQSFFLFGPRGTGKSTWVRTQFPTAPRIDLLDEVLYHDYAASSCCRPGDARRRVTASTCCRSAISWTRSKTMPCGHERCAAIPVFKQPDDDGLVSHS